MTIDEARAAYHWARVRHELHSWAREYGLPLLDECERLRAELARFGPRAVAAQAVDDYFKAAEAAREST